MRKQNLLCPLRGRNNEDCGMKNMTGNGFKKAFCRILCCVLGLMTAFGASAEGNETRAGGTASAAAAETGNNRVFYEIFVGSFSDSDGDGTGDIRGIINRLDYLNDGDPMSENSLGVEGIWLTPVFSSPSYHKYDITDYYTVDPQFGTVEDLKELTEECHRRGMIVILDLPINHTGRENKWFKNFTNAHLLHNPDHRYYDWYTWLPADSKLPAGRHFMKMQGTGEYYECNFSDDMPELNFDNPAVRQAVLDVAKFYLDLGVDGFRFDAAKYIYYGDHKRSAEFWQWFIGELKQLKPDIYTVAEVWDSDGITDVYESALNCFDFTVSQSGGLIASTAKQGDVNKYTAYVEGYILKISALSPDARYTPFIANHDTDRAAGYLTVASHHAGMAANLYILGPGSPFIYYGEEIGLRGSRGGANTDANRRLAMLWGDGDTVRDPVGTTYDASKQTPYSVSDLENMDGSILKYYRRLIGIRRVNPEIAAGEYRALVIPGTKVGGFTSTLNGSSVTVIHNTTNNTVTVDLTAVPGACSETLTAFIGEGEATLENGVLTVSSHTSAVIR